MMEADRSLMSCLTPTVFLFRLWRAFVCGVVMLALLPAGAVEPAHQRKNSLGAVFLKVEGADVLFADTETRVSDFTAFVHESGYTWNERTPFPQTGEHPVVNVSIVDAVAFCDWLTHRDRGKKLITQEEIYRLPTNGEWDIAAGVISKSTKEVYPWGTQWPPPDHAGNFNTKAITGKDDGFAHTAPVGSFEPSPSGLHDLAGNVWEWAVDGEAGKEGIASLRGGSWAYFRKECLLSSYRYSVPATIRKPTIGFRCVLEDTRRSSVPLASASQEVRDRLNGPTGASNEKIEEMKKKLLERNALSDDEKRGAAELMKQQRAGRAEAASSDAPSRLSKDEGGTGELFVNSLGMRFLRLNGPLMMGEHEVREKDVENWFLATDRQREHKPGFSQTGEHPAANITWVEARDFCVWLTERERGSKSISLTALYRLPSDSEWSAAAGLPDEKGDSPEAKNLAEKTQYPWGTQWPPPILSANLDAARVESYADNYQYTAPVCSFKPNALGFHDLGGNVAEWCEDRWPSAGGERVIRGGSWLTSVQIDLLTSARKHLKESGYRADLGFRIVLVTPR